MRVGGCKFFISVARARLRCLLIGWQDSLVYKPANEGGPARRAHFIIVRCSDLTMNGYHASKLKDAKVLCDCLLGHVRVFDQFANRQLSARRQALEDQPPRGVCKSV